jgi:hypothetical protein
MWVGMEDKGSGALSLQSSKTKGACETVRAEKPLHMRCNDQSECMYVCVYRHTLLVPSLRGHTHPDLARYFIGVPIDVGPSREFCHSTVRILAKNSVDLLQSDVLRRAGFFVRYVRSDKWVAVATAWRVLRLRMEERTPDV